MEVTARSSDPRDRKKDCGHYGGCFSAVYKEKMEVAPPKDHRRGGGSVIPGQPEYE